MKNVEILGNESENDSSKSDSGSSENGNRNHIRARIGKISDKKKVESSTKVNEGAKCGYEVKNLCFIFQLFIVKVER